MSSARRSPTLPLPLQVDVGHLSKGRWEEATPHIAVIAPDPGLPRQRRGTLLVLVDLVGGGDRWTFLARALVETVARSYAQAPGGVQEGLRKGLGAADGLLREENQDRGAAPVLAGISCGMHRGSDLFLAQGGPAFCAHLSHRRGSGDGAGSGPWEPSRSPVRAHYYPSPVAWRGEPAREIRPLGSGDEPAVAVHHIILRTDDTIVFSNAALPNLMERSEFESALEAETPEEVRRVLGRLASGGGSILVIRALARPIEVEAPTEGEERPSAAPEPPEGPALEPMEAPAGPSLFDRVADRVERGGLALGRWLRILLGQMLPEGERAPATPKVRRSLRQKERRRRRRRLLAAAGIAVVAVLAFGAVLWWSGQVREGQARALLDQAERIVAAAEATEDGTEVQGLLGEALGLLAQLEEMDPGQPAIGELRGRVWDREDRFAGITRLPSLRIALALTGPAESHARVLYIGDLLYLLDGGAGVVYRYRWRAESESLQTPPEGAVLLGGDEVGGIEDILWMPSSEARGDAALMVVGRFGLLEHAPGGAVASIGVAETIWAPAVRAAGFEGSLYLLEREQGRILRYLPTGRTYNLAPTDYLGVESRIDLTDPIDLAIDGAVLVLRSDGAVLKFTAGEIQPFSQAGLSTPLSRPTAIHAVGDRVYVADPEARRVVVFRDSGESLGELRAPRDEEEAFAGLRSVFVDREAGLLFLVSGQRLYTASLPESP
ncbi:MAG: hypothetical protein ACE5NC_06450 [Anaerolineae bacterium]